MEANSTGPAPKPSRPARRSKGMPGYNAIRLAECRPATSRVSAQMSEVPAANCFQAALGLNPTIS